MANLIQLRELEKLSGLVLVDKPAGIAFASVLKAVKRKFNLVKVGHGGSLDAMASGLFPVVIGEANKFANELMLADREYEGTMRLGVTTDTGDIFGRPEAMASNPAPVDELRGDIFQTEPRFCAIRKEGTAEYEIVDTGEHAQFMTHVYRFYLDGNSFRLKCTARTIVRALAKEMGATLESLRRTRIGKLSVAEAIPFARLLEMEIKELPSCVTPTSQVLR